MPTFCIQAFSHYKLFPITSIETNLSLAEKLAQDFHVDLPEFDSERDPEAYFAEVSEKILSYPRWRVVREMAIGLFSFSKLLMYRELNQNHGPEARHPVEHPIVAKLLGDTEAPSDHDSDLQLAEIFNVDRHQNAHEVQLVMDADSSQHSALIDALIERKNLVIHGPPGTGKSQTITNLIAAALANGKSILFVAEKSAALEVVKSRLDRCGLGEFVLELHSLRTNKGQLHRELERRLHQQFVAPQDMQEQEANLGLERLQLLSYTEAAQMPTGPDQEPFFKIAFRASRLRSFAKPDFPEYRQGEFPLLSRGQIEERARLIHEVAELWHALPQPTRQAWDGMDLHNAFEADLQGIPHLLSRLRTAATEGQQSIASSYGEEQSISYSITQLQAITTLHEILATSPPPKITSSLWLHFLSESIANQIRALHDRLSGVPTLTKASSVFPQTSDNFNKEFLAQLHGACLRLRNQGFHEKTVSQLDVLQQNIGHCSNAIKQLLTCRTAAQEVSGTEPVYLHDFEKLLALVGLFEKMPVLVEQAFELAWLRPDTPQSVLPASARDFRSIMRLPSCRRTLTDRKEEAHDTIAVGPSRRTSPARHPPIRPVARESAHLTRAHSPTPVDAGHCPDRTLAPDARGQTARPHPPGPETAAGRNASRCSGPARALSFPLCGSADARVAGVDGGGRGATRRWDPAPDYL
ncbi:MAG: hypothetical protein HOP18_20970 [Deltaproteobacteria bacterium]|nr:hypothetical protein [Deltaproteobacteria bacterium]